MYIKNVYRVRGGSSTSFLAKSGQSNARFYGHLDTTTLGGAGFASQKSIYQSIPYDLSQYKGIRLSIVKSDDMKYAFNLQTTVPSSDGQSAVEYKYSFEPKKLNLESASESGSDESIHRVQTLDIKFSDFVAHYRGRKVPNPEPLETSHITTFSIMCQSYFDQQSGDFELVLHEIAAYK